MTFSLLSRNAIRVLPDRKQEANPFSARFDAEYGGDKLRVSPDAAPPANVPASSAPASAAAAISASRYAYDDIGDRTTTTAADPARTSPEQFTQKFAAIPSVQLRASLRRATFV